MWQVYNILLYHIHCLIIIRVDDHLFVIFLFHIIDQNIIMIVVILLEL